jgi:predicted RNA-binding Zn-ribbon protein involved in translation (DUF1610 family)
VTLVTWTPTVCPTCGDELPGLGTYCEGCAAYVEDMGATTDATPEARARAIKDTRLEDERKSDARPTIEALGWRIRDMEQGYRPFACKNCGAHIAGGTRVPLGFPDQIVTGFGLVAFLEWKTDTNKPTADQLRFADDCDADGIPYAVIHNTREAVEFLSDLRSRV